jgi:uncharacterized protein YuzE
MTQETITLEVSADDQDVAYLKLPGHQHRSTLGCAARTVSLSSLLTYGGAEILLDLDEDGWLIGIEILA